MQVLNLNGQTIRNAHDAEVSADFSACTANLQYTCATCILSDSIVSVGSIICAILLGQVSLPHSEINATLTQSMIEWKSSVKLCLIITPTVVLILAIAPSISE